MKSNFIALLSFDVLCTKNVNKQVKVHFKLDIGIKEKQLRKNLAMKQEGYQCKQI